MKTVAHERLRFLDEAGATTVLTRLYARAIGGGRTTEAVPRWLRSVNLDDFNRRVFGRAGDDAD